MYPHRKTSFSSGSTAIEFLNEAENRKRDPSGVMKQAPKNFQWKNSKIVRIRCPFYFLLLSRPKIPGEMSVIFFPHFSLMGRGDPGSTAALISSRLENVELLKGFVNTKKPKFIESELCF